MVSSPLVRKLAGWEAGSESNRPVYNIASLYENVDVSTPVPILVYDTRHLEHASCIFKVAVDIADSNNSLREAGSWFSDGNF